MNIPNLKPYLFNAFYNWCLDSEWTPHLQVNARIAGVVVPVQHISNGNIVLNISPQAIRDLSLGAREISFMAMFNGQPEEVTIPYVAMMCMIIPEVEADLPIGNLISAMDISSQIERMVNFGGSAKAKKLARHNSDGRRLRPLDRDATRATGEPQGFKFIEVSDVPGEGSGKGEEGAAAGDKPQQKTPDNPRESTDKPGEGANPAGDQAGAKAGKPEEGATPGFSIVRP